MKQWIPAGVIGMAAVMTGMSFGVIRPNDLVGVDVMMTLTMTLAIGVWGVVIALVPLGLIAYAVRRVSLGSASVEWRTAMDLGADRSEIVRRETLDGLRLGAIVSGAGAVLGVVLTMVLPYFQPGDGGSPLPSVFALAGLLLCYAALVGGTGLVYRLAARSATKPGPRPGFATGLEHDASAAPSRPGFSRRMKVTVTMFAFSLGVLAVDRVVGLAPDSADSTIAWISGTLTLLRWVAGLSGVVVGARVIAGATQRLSSWGGSMLARSRHARATAFSLGARIAADGLARRSSLRMLAAGAIGGVMALATVAAASDSLDQRGAELQAAYLVDYTVASVEWWDDVDLPSGAVQQPLDADIVEALLEDERVVAIPYGVAVGDPFEWVAIDDEQAAAEGLSLQDTAAIDAAASSGSSAVTTGSTRASTLVVDPDALTVRDPDGLRPLGFQDGTITTAYGMPQWEWQWFDETRDDLFRLSFTNTTPFVTRDWAESTIGEVPIVGVLLWPADAGIPLDGGVLGGEGLTTADGALLDQAVRDAGGAGLPTFDATGSADGGGISIVSGFFGTLAWVVVPFALLGAGLSVSLGLASVKDRRREMATLAALGASPAALRVAPAIEVGVTVLAATIVALPSGLLLGMVLNHPTLVMAGAPLDAGETLWTFWWQLTHVALGVPLTVAAVTLLASTTVALILGSTMAKGSPVDELRAADKEGIR